MRLQGQSPQPTVYSSAIWAVVGFCALFSVSALADSQTASPAPAPRRCPDPPTGSAQARVELTPQGLQKAVTWGFKQGLLITSFELPKSPPPDDKSESLLGSYVSDYTNQQVPNIQFGTAKISCNTSMLCDIDLPITALTYKVDYAVHKKNSTDDLISIKGLQATVKPNAQGEIPSVHFQARINPQGTSKDWLQILDSGEKVSLPVGSYSMSRDNTQIVSKAHLSNQGYDLAHWLVDDLASPTKIGSRIASSIVKSEILPIVINHTRPYIQAGIPVVHDDLTEDLPLFRIQDTIDLSQIDIHATDEKLAAKTLGEARTLAQIKKDLSGLSTEFSQVLAAFKNIRDESSAQPEFDLLRKVWAPEQDVLRAKLAQLKATPANVTAIMKPLDTFLSGLDEAQKVVHANALKAKETFAIRAAALMVDNPTHSLDLAMSVCVYCTPDPIQAVPLSSFPTTKSKKDYDSAVQIPLSALNSIVKQYYDNDAFSICVSEITLQNCAFAPPDERKIRVQFKDVPKIKEDKDGLYVEVGQFEKSGVAYGILDQLAGAKIRVNVGVDNKKGTITITPNSPELSFQSDPNSLQTQISNSLVKGFQQASQQALPMVKKELDAHWSEYLKPYTKSLSSLGIAIQSVDVSGNAITTYEDTELPDLDVASIFADDSTTATTVPKNGGVKTTP